MLKNNRWFVLLFMALLLFLGAKACSPVPLVYESKCRVKNAVLKDLHKDENGTIFLHLVDDQTTYYITKPRSAASLELENMNAKLINNSVTIKYPRYWTPLDPFGHQRELSKLETTDSIWFARLR